MSRLCVPSRWSAAMRRLHACELGLLNGYQLQSLRSVAPSLQGRASASNEERAPSLSTTQRWHVRSTPASATDNHWFSIFRQQCRRRVLLGSSTAWMICCPLRSCIWCSLSSASTATASPRHSSACCASCCIGEAGRHCWSWRRTSGPHLNPAAGRARCAGSATRASTSHSWDAHSTRARSIRRPSASSSDGMIRPTAAMRMPSPLSARTTACLLCQCERRCCRRCARAQFCRLRSWSTAATQAARGTLTLPRSHSLDCWQRRSNPRRSNPRRSNPRCSNPRRSNPRRSNPRRSNQAHPSARLPDPLLLSSRCRCMGSPAGHSPTRSVRTARGCCASPPRATASYSPTKGVASLGWWPRAPEPTLRFTSLRTRQTLQLQATQR